MLVTLYKDYMKLEIRNENSRWPRKLSTGDSAVVARCTSTKVAPISSQPFDEPKVSVLQELGRIKANGSVGGLYRDRGPASSI